MANGYYTHSTYPATNSTGSSAAMRAEFDAIMSGLNLLPNPLGLGQQGFSGGSWTNPVISGGSLDNTAIGATAQNSGKFTSLSASGLATLGAGASMTGTFTALAGAVLSAFAITGGSIDNAPIGQTTPAAATFTQLAVNGPAAFNGPIVTTGGFASSAGTMELGSTTLAQTSYIDFHSSGQALDYDARIAGTGGGTTAGQGTLTYTAAAHAFSARPTFAGQTPWDTSNLASPFQTTGGTISGATNFAVRPTFAGQTPWDTGNLPNPFQTTGGTITGATAFSSRPSFNGATPWDTANFNPGSYVAFGQTATYADSALAVRDGANPANSRMVFHFNGQGGQPTWLWGGNDGTNMYVYNPSGFNVSYANSAGSAGSAGSVGGVSSPATSGSTCQWNTGIVELASMEGGNTVDASAAYVVVGARCTVSTDINRVYFRVVQLRNQ